jgi:hypothetical protein
VFRSNDRTQTALIKHLWERYVFGKQTVRELAKHFNKDRRTTKSLLEKYTPKQKQHHPRLVHLIVDATYFGERKEETCWCVVVARDMYKKEDLWWSFTKTETASVYRQMREELEALGYIIISVTGDGFGGIRTAFFGIYFQMCQVHMERLVIKGTTRNPKLEAGAVLLALVRNLHDTDSNTFQRRIKQYIEKYRDFLNEKTFNPITGEQYWTHKELRGSVFSLVRLQKYLFTYEHNRKIPKTTNSLEGHFRHINEVIAIHCGLAREQKEKVLHTILLAGTVAPGEEILKKIL